MNQEILIVKLPLDTTTATIVNEYCRFGRIMSSDFIENSDGTKNAVVRYEHEHEAYEAYHSTTSTHLFGLGIFTVLWMNQDDRTCASQDNTLALEPLSKRRCMGEIEQETKLLSEHGGGVLTCAWYWNRIAELGEVPFTMCDSWQLLDSTERTTLFHTTSKIYVKYLYPNMRLSEICRLGNCYSQTGCCPGVEEVSEDEIVMHLTVKSDRRHVIEAIWEYRRYDMSNYIQIKSID